MGELEGWGEEGGAEWGVGDGGGGGGGKKEPRGESGDGESRGSEKNQVEIRGGARPDKHHQFLLA